MGKKIQCIGRYVMDGHVLGKGNFARVELATHGITGCKYRRCSVVVLPTLEHLHLPKDIFDNKKKFKCLKPVKSIRERLLFNFH
ncbi:hypothetical protein ACJMK2_042642 [Sinanodonta woodiana]|uniref:Uncharacterized protein n=1 Tax=Sinanodonta woodiana TaxID=1069815 RepID=A0ABD3WBT5_SINWO